MMLITDKMMHSKIAEFAVGHRIFKIFYSGKIKNEKKGDNKIVVGETDHLRNLVTIGDGLSSQDSFNAFIHEALHCSLVVLGENELNDNECFVERLSTIMSQALLTAELQ
jgi:hypothetical protein